MHTWVFHVLDMRFALSTHGVHPEKKVSAGDVFLSGDVSILIYALLEECRMEDVCFVWAMFRCWCLHVFIRIVFILFSVAGFMFVILSVTYSRCFRSSVLE